MVQEKRSVDLAVLTKTSVCLHDTTVATPQGSSSTTREAAAVRSLRTAMKRVAPLVTSRERPPLTATVESRCIEKPTHRDEESGPAHHKWRATPLVETRVAPAHCNWRKSTQQQRPSTAKNKSEKESDTSQVFRNYNVS